jgi:hypothetical protein
MAARISAQVRNPVAAQAVPAFPIEYFSDLRTGQRLRRECLGEVHGGYLILGNIARSTGIDLYYRRSMGNPRKPQRDEMDAHMRKFIGECWTSHLRRPGLPKVQRYGNLIWLALMPLGEYAVGGEPGGGSVLYRFRPVVRRPRAALTVALDARPPVTAAIGFSPSSRPLAISAGRYHCR